MAGYLLFFVLVSMATALAKHEKYLAPKGVFAKDCHNDKTRLFK